MVTPHPTPLRIVAASALLLGAWGTTCHAGDGDDQAPVLTETRCSPGPAAGSQELRVQVDRGRHPTQLLVFYRTPQQGSYRTQAMEDLGAGLYQTTLAHVGSTAEAVECHFALLDEHGTSTNVGSSDHPMVLMVSREEESSLSILVLAGAGAVSLLPLLAAGSLLSRLRRARLCSDDTAFWRRKLGGLAHLSGPELSRCIGELSRSPLPHPRYGAIRWKRPFLYEKLRQLKLQRPPTARPVAEPWGRAEGPPGATAPSRAPDYPRRMPR